MSFWIEGWVEITTFIGLEQSEDYAWSSVVDLGALIDAADAISEQLFGLSKRCVSGKFNLSPLAANRGLPSNPSPQVRKEMEMISEHEQHYGEGEFGGYTHALWREIKASSVQETANQSDWSVVFDIVHRLEQDQRFSDDQIRFVVWYLW